MAEVMAEAMAEEVSEVVLIMETKMRILGTIDSRPTQEILMLLGKSLLGCKNIKIINLNMRKHMSHLLIDLGGLLHQVGLLEKPYLLMFRVIIQKEEEALLAPSSRDGLDKKQLKTKVCILLFFFFSPLTKSKMFYEVRAMQVLNV